MGKYCTFLPKDEVIWGPFVGDGNNIGAEGAKGLFLPPGLKILDLRDNNIDSEALKALILPPEFKEVIVSFQIYDLLDEDQGYMLEDYHMSKEHPFWRRYGRTTVAEYNHVLQHFRKLILIDICRCLIFGRTHDPVLKLLQNSGNNIRMTVLSYLNPFSDDGFATPTPVCKPCKRKCMSSPSVSGKRGRT